MVKKKPYPSYFVLQIALETKDIEEEGAFLREGGLGLYLIETLMDEVKVHHQEGVTIFMTKHVEGEQVEKDVETVSS